MQSHLPIRCPSRQSFSALLCTITEGVKGIKRCWDQSVSPSVCLSVCLWQNGAFQRIRDFCDDALYKSTFTITITITITIFRHVVTVETPHNTKLTFVAVDFP